MRIGFFGGSFDPPHRGHLAVARAAMNAFALERVLLAPAALQPLKRARADAHYRDRLNMVELLCAEANGLEPSMVDAPQLDDSPNYTIDTLARLRASLPDATEIFVIVGADSFLTLRDWRKPNELLLAAEWIVVSRPGFDLHALAPLGLTDAQRARVHLLGDVNEPVSATEIRARLRAGTDCLGLLPERILAYIREHELYRARPTHATAALG
jgi:nicotinate-nucleotide adenylyltransferase